MAQTEAVKNDDTFLLEIVSPERVLSSEPVRFAVLPALEGGIGVLPGHSPVLTALKPGIIEIHGAAANDDVRKVFVSNGFLEINEKQCIALTVDAVAVDYISKEESELEYQRLVEALGNAETDAERVRLEKELNIHKTRLEVVYGKIIA